MKPFLPWLSLLLAAAPGYSQDVRSEAAEAMKRAAAFMMQEVAFHDGFVTLYTEDLSERWGEVPARPSMIWVQEAGTVTVGRVMLEAYKATRDDVYLLYAKRVAAALAAGQHASGGWHYFIDFDPAGTAQWYAEVATKCWGWEEFYHYYGNCTFDDGTTTGAADFLLDLYMASKDATVEAPLRKAIHFILDAQYPIGGWPQRFPLSTPEHPEPIDDYSSYHTFNDDVIAGNIVFLWKAADALGDKACREAALRGMHFVALSQYGAPQGGWADQYTMALEPGAARGFEPAGLSPGTTVANVNQLMKYFGLTGDRRFLRGVPDALDWLDRARLPEGHAANGETHATFVEVGTDRPLYAHREGSGVEDGRYWVDYDPHDFPGHYGMQMRIDVAPLRAEYARISALSPEEAKADYLARQAAASRAPVVAEDAVRGILAAMNDRGAWVEDLTVVDYLDWKFRPRRTFRGISTVTFAANMRTLIHYVENKKGAR